MTTRASRLTALALATTAILAISACSGGTASGAPSAPAGASEPARSAATGSDPVCADVTAVQSAIADLKGLDLKAVGTNGLTEAVTAVETAVTSLSASAGTTAAAEREALKASLDSLKTAIAGLTSDASVQEKALELTTAFAAVETAAKGVQAALPGCGG